MKIKSILKELVVLSFMVFAFACSSDDGDGGGDSAVASSITVNVNESTVFEGETVAFTVTNNLGLDVTPSSTFEIAGATITNPYTFDTVGSYQVTGTNGAFTNTITITVEEVPVPTAITLTANKDAFWYDEGDVTFTVMDDLGNNVTGIVTYSAESGTLTNPATFNTAGEYNAVATFTLPDNSTITSNSVKLTAAESTHTTKVMVEDYTGTWCGYCPRLATALENTVNQNANVIPVALHREYNGDPGYPTHFPPVISMLSTFNVGGFPSGRINRTINWNESSSQPIGYLNSRQNMGLAINSSISGNTITAEVKVHYDLGISGEQKLVVYLLENGLEYPQVNYYNNDPSSPWYQTGDPIQGFVHDHTARALFTDVLGDIIPAANTETGDTYTANLTLTVPASVQNNNNLELVAFVVGSNKTVLNVQKADLGENKDFD